MCIQQYIPTPIEYYIPAHVNFIESYWANIYIAGDVTAIENACRAFCMTGLCVTVTPTNYIFTGGSESGCIVGLIDYPRFPASSKEVWEKAVKLAKVLLDVTYQRSCTIVAKDNSYYLESEKINIPR